MISYILFIILYVINKICIFNKTINQFLGKDVAKLKFKLFESNRKLFFALAITSDIFLAFSIFLKSI